MTFLHLSRVKSYFSIPLTTFQIWMSNINSAARTKKRADSLQFMDFLPFPSTLKLFIALREQTNWNLFRIQCTSIECKNGRDGRKHPEISWLFSDRNFNWTWWFSRKVRRRWRWSMTFKETGLCIMKNHHIILRQSANLFFFVEQKSNATRKSDSIRISLKGESSWERYGQRESERER